jgi:hypothetical protein
MILTRRANAPPRLPLASQTNFSVTIPSGAPHTLGDTGARPTAETKHYPRIVDVRLEMLSLNEDEVKDRLIYHPTILLFAAQMSTGVRQLCKSIGTATAAPLPASIRPPAFACHTACAALRSWPPCGQQRRGSWRDRRQNRRPETRHAVEDQADNLAVGVNPGDEL